MPDTYDTRYPDSVAGHVEAGSFITDDAIRTTHGDDEFFTGDEIDRSNLRGVESVGPEATNRAIGRAVDKAEKRGKRTPVTDAAEDWRCGNVVLTDANAIRLVIANVNRKDVVISNQSAALIYAGKESGLRAGAPNTCYLPAGQGRTFTHKADIWVVGIAGQIVDFVETNYA
jgi:hypothetical protein